MTQEESKELSVDSEQRTSYLTQESKEPSVHSKEQTIIFWLKIWSKTNGKQKEYW